MNGMINWNELWKMMKSRFPWSRTFAENPSSYWDKRAEQLNEVVMQSKDKEQTERRISKIELYPEYTVLDVGSGSGRLAISIAKRVKMVTAVDQSRGMLACLKENMEKEDVKNIVCVNKRWEDIELGVDIESHDVVIASGSLSMFDMQGALAKMDVTAKGCVYLFEFAGRWMDEGLWNEIYGEKHLAWPDYIYIYNILHDMEIYANVEVMDLEFEERYNSLDEAVNRWKETHDIPSEKDEVLRALLSKTLIEDDGTLCLKRKYKSAMMWWGKNHENE